jgi:hypothetical protein
LALRQLMGAVMAGMPSFTVAVGWGRRSLWASLSSQPALISLGTARSAFTTPPASLRTASTAEREHTSALGRSCRGCSSPSECEGVAAGLLPGGYVSTKPTGAQDKTVRVAADWRNSPPVRDNPPG